MTFPLTEPVQRLIAARTGTGALAESIAAYAAGLLEANQTLNLTGDRDPRLFNERHIEDALHAAAALEQALGAPIAPAMKIIDLGSGGGLPGILWALFWPSAEITLLEAREKKCAFLEAMISRLGLANAQVRRARAEELGHDPAHREAYDLATARALAPLPVLLELALPLVRVGGTLGAIKALPLDQEISAAGRARRLLGAPEAPRLAPYTRSDGKACAVCLVRKNAPTPPHLPRRPGVPAGNPL